MAQIIHLSSVAFPLGGGSNQRDENYEYSCTVLVEVRKQGSVFESVEKGVTEKWLKEFKECTVITWLVELLKAN